MRKGKVTGTSGRCRRTAGFALGLAAAFAAPGARAWTASNAFVVTRRLPCPVCGAASGSPPATNLVETAFAEWEWTTPAGALHGPSCSFVRPGVRKGRHAETRSVRASCPDCSLCTAEKSVSAAFTVSELSVSCPAWLGLDRRAGAPGRAEVVAIAILDPEVEGTACDWSVAGICTGEPVPWDGWLLRISASNDDPASRAYLAERVTATALGATASADFTVVSVEVGAGGGAGGTLVPHAADAAGGDLTAAGTNALVAVSVSVEPQDLPAGERIVLGSPKGHLYARRGGRAYRLPERASLSLGELRRIGLALHGHAVSGKPRDRTLAASHDASGAGDGCAFTVVGLDFSAVSDGIAPYDDVSDGSLIDSRTATVTVRTSPEVGGDDLASLPGGISFRSEPVEAEKQEKGLKGLVNERSETDISFTHLSNSVWRASTVRWYGVLPERECAFYSHRYRFSLLLGGVAVTNHEYGVKWPEKRAEAFWFPPTENGTTCGEPKYYASGNYWYCEIRFADFVKETTGEVSTELHDGRKIPFVWTGQYAKQVRSEEDFHVLQSRGAVPPEWGGLTDCYTVRGIQYFIGRQAENDPNIVTNTWIVKAPTAEVALDKADKIIKKAVMDEILQSISIYRQNEGFQELMAKEHAGYNAAYRYHCSYRRVFGDNPVRVWHPAYKEEKEKYEKNRKK